MLIGIGIDLIHGLVQITGNQGLAFIGGLEPCFTLLERSAQIGLGIDPALHRADAFGELDPPPVHHALFNFLFLNRIDRFLGRGLDHLAVVRNLLLVREKRTCDNFGRIR